MAQLSRGEAAGQAVATSEWLACLVVVVTVSLAVILFLWVNPAFAAAVVIAGLMVFMGERRWWLIVAVPAVCNRRHLGSFHPCWARRLDRRR